MKPTQYNDINKVLLLLKDGLISILGDNLTALYLTGSLTYGDFDRDSSDIDFLVVMEHVLSDKQLQQVKRMHQDIGNKFLEWSKRIDGSYITKRMLINTEPPKEPRPYVNANKMYSLVYGNEWIINLYALYDSGIALFGTDIKKLIRPVSITKVREASKKNLLEEWQPKLKEPAPFEEEDYNRDHLQAYAILTMCRILYTAYNDKIVSKKVASAWAKKSFDKLWSELIEKAENWKHGKEMNAQKETLKFIQFTIDKISSNKN